MQSALAYKEEYVSEIIDGREVLMSPRPAVNHNKSIKNLTIIFGNYLKGKRCQLFIDGMEVHIDEKNTFVPDLFIVCDKSKIKNNGIFGAPDLVVEVLSPSSVNRDRGIKKDPYEKAGFKEYWIVDPVSKSIEVFHLREGRFVMDHTYIIFPEWEWEQMTETERAAARLSVKVSLYDDLTVDLREVFDDV